MKKLPVILALSLLSRTAHGEKVVSLQQMDLTDVPGKEGLMVTVEIAPGESVPKHRHNSDVFVYVLSGTIVTQVQGQSAKTLHAGEAFFEAPADIHIDSISVTSDALPTVCSILAADSDEEDLLTPVRVDAAE